MESTRIRAIELLPSVLLTLLSMIQALALELLWSQLREGTHLWRFGWPGVIGWLQLGTLLLMLLLIWVFYANLVMRFRWLPSMQDSIVPFGIGLMEFMLIDLSGPGRLGAWFIVLAAGFAGFSWASYEIFQRLRKDPANREFFAAVPPAGRRDLAFGLATFSGLASLGLALELTGNESWLALAALATAATLLIHQLSLTHYYWQLSLAQRPLVEADS